MVNVSFEGVKLEFVKYVFVFACFGVLNNYNVCEGFVKRVSLDNF